MYQTILERSRQWSTRPTHSPTGSEDFLFCLIEKWGHTHKRHLWIRYHYQPWLFISLVDIVTRPSKNQSTLEKWYIVLVDGVCPYVIKVKDFDHFSSLCFGYCLSVDHYTTQSLWILFFFSRRSMAYSNVVINLIGKEWGTRNFSLQEVHVDGPARLARIAREMGVERFIHISHINAREDPQVRSLI